MPCFAHSASSRARNTWAMVAPSLSQSARSSEPARVIPAGEGLVSIVGYGDGCAVGGAHGRNNAGVQDVWGAASGSSRTVPSTSSSVSSTVKASPRFSVRCKLAVAMLMPQLARTDGDVGQNARRVVLVHDHTRMLAGDIHVDSVDAANHCCAAADGHTAHIEGAPLEILAVNIDGVGVIDGRWSVSHTISMVRVGCLSANSKERDTLRVVSRSSPIMPATSALSVP